MNLRIRFPSIFNLISSAAKTCRRTTVIAQLYNLVTYSNPLTSPATLKGVHKMKANSRESAVTNNCVFCCDWRDKTCVFFTALNCLLNVVCSSDVTSIRRHSAMFYCEMISDVQISYYNRTTRALQMSPCCYRQQRKLKAVSNPLLATVPVCVGIRRVHLESSAHVYAHRK